MVDVWQLSHARGKMVSMTKFSYASTSSVKDPVFSLTRKKFDAYDELMALVMKQRDWWNRPFHIIL
jgi:hypothetical protein